MEETSNQITLRGTLLGLPCPSHENHGRNFYRFTLEVPRLSGTADLVPVVAEESLLNQLDLSGGSMLKVIGQIRSHNIRTDGIRHLMVFVFARSLEADEEEPINECRIRGILCRAPLLRRTPLGRQICDVMLAVPRTCGRADYLPCILWGKVAKQGAACSAGDPIQIDGRLQSRNYTKQGDNGPEERTAYEVSAMQAVFSSGI